ncbi:MAG: HepT-like ribonuclease domain-containing protein [Actinomycetota bacterium]
MEDRTRRTLEELLAFAAMGARLVERGHGAYLADEALRLASEAVLHRVGEAAARLDPSFIDGQPSVRWRAMKAMRNVLAHEHGAIDHDLLWTTLEHELPVEADAVARILSDAE